MLSAPRAVDKHHANSIIKFNIDPAEVAEIDQRLPH
jgi:hypothetical protein